MAAIFDFLLIHTSGSLSSSLSIHIAWPPKHGYIVAIPYVRWDECACVLRAAILDFWLPVTSDSVANGTIEKFDPENIGVATRIVPS